MSDSPRPASRLGTRNPTERQIWITRGHMAALGVATFFIALLAFLVGIQVGRSTAEPVELPTRGVAFLPDVAEADALEALLREVELAQTAIAPSGEPATQESRLTFPDVLAAADPMAAAAVPPLVPPDVDVAVPAENLAGQAAPPGAGWSIQVASFPDPIEADALIQSLTTEKLAAYRVAGLVDGQTWYRVRVGGFASREDADSARLTFHSRFPEVVVAPL